MKIAAVVVSSASLAGTAAADLIAGWDFSQYRVDGSLDTGAGPVDTLPANYSRLDVNFPVGAGGTDPGDSGDFGTMFMDGSNGSTNVSEAAASPEVVARASNTSANRFGPYKANQGVYPPISRIFDAFNTLAAKGQTHQSRTALTARSTVDIVFQADQTVVAPALWELSFAGWAEGQTGTVEMDVEFSTDCSSYGFVSTIVLPESQEAFDVPLGSVTDDVVCVRFRLDDTNGQPVIDNVAVPEPGAGAMLVAGALALIGLERRRRA